MASKSENIAAISLENIKVDQDPKAKQVFLTALLFFTNMFTVQCNIYICKGRTVFVTNTRAGIHKTC